MSEDERLIGFEKFNLSCAYYGHMFKNCTNKNHKGHGRGLAHEKCDANTCPIWQSLEAPVKKVRETSDDRFICCSCDEDYPKAFGWWETESGDKQCEYCHRK